MLPGARTYLLRQASVRCRSGEQGTFVSQPEYRGSRRVRGASLANGTCGTWIPPASSSADPYVGRCRGDQPGRRSPPRLPRRRCRWDVHPYLASAPRFCRAKMLSAHREAGWHPAGLLSGSTVAHARRGLCSRGRRQEDRLAGLPDRAAGSGGGGCPRPRHACAQPARARRRHPCNTPATIQATNTRRRRGGGQGLRG